MRIRLVAKKIKMTDAIRELIESRLEKLEDFADSIVWADVSVTVEKQEHKADVVLHVEHQTLKASASTDDLYSAIDKVMTKIESQVKKYREKATDHHASQVVNGDEVTTLIGPEIRFTVVKDVPVAPMTADEAVIEMEKLGYNFWFYQDKLENRMQLVFKRLDGTYGLLQPVKK